MSCPGTRRKDRPLWQRKRATGKEGRLSPKLPGPILTVSSALRVEHWLINVNSCSATWATGRSISASYDGPWPQVLGTRRGDRTTVDGFLTKVLNVYYMYTCIVCGRMRVYVCQIASPRSPSPPRRVSVSLSPCALVLRPARKIWNARLRGALYTTRSITIGRQLAAWGTKRISRSRSEKRPGRLLC